MEEKSSCGKIGYQIQVAPFVAKTYQMVNDPRTDAWIRWGNGNNSFLVLDPADFSHLLLPSYFKHSNFSSFVRQLNTYGFKKVDPDRWEFAHESFLRGQTHLLPCIVRRKKRNEGGSSSSSSDKKEGIEGEEEEESLFKELGRLRQEQRALDEELQRMNKRLQATERRPQQMMSFLVKVAEDPDFLPRLILSKKQQLAPEKKRRLVAPSTPPSFSPPPPPPPSLLMASAVSPPLDIDSAAEQTNFSTLGHQAGPLTLEAERLLLMASSTLVDTGCDGGVGVDNSISYTNVRDSDTVISGNHMRFLPEFGVAETSSTTQKAVPFPFSLLGHGFV
ncbi:heat stress transcription factor C-1b-like [Phoenix dactylifera]|uniref:Heat stress transcription factor C-1b-like n=1 Tax=Phoenix dactylifera TaxID=42345 RepID=A0A8B9AK50_PHODC|nr:heat stress transcription factor C-1b-like [Phoenix dactylifera]XP_038987096.1 heat stress transcription factor C-1b-like [Phoenix dactylifera]